MCLVLTCLPGAAVMPGRAGAAAIPYTVATEGHVSLAVYDGQGHLVRALLAGTPRRPGSYSPPWDGLIAMATPCRRATRPAGCLWRRIRSMTRWRR